MATDNGLRLPENVIEANNIYHILLTLLQGALWHMYQVQRPQNNGEILIDKSDLLTGIEITGKETIALSCTKASF